MRPGDKSAGISALHVGPISPKGRNPDRAGEKFAFGEPSREQDK